MSVLQTNEQLVAIVRDGKAELSKKYEQYMQTTKERTVPVEAKRRKYVQIDVEKTQQRVIDRMSRFTVPVFCFVDNLSPVQAIVYVGMAYVKGSFRLVEADLKLELSSFGARSNCFDIHTTEMIVSQHAIERWLERNESEDYKEALYQLGNSLIAMNHQLLTKQFVDIQEVYGHLERQIECNDGGFAIVKVENPEIHLLRERIATVVTYISRDMLKSWNIEKANEEFSNVSDIDWSQRVSERVALAMDKISKLMKEDDRLKKL